MSDEIEQDSVQPEAPVAAESQPEIAAPQPEAAPPSPWEAFKQLPEFSGQDDRAIAGRLYQAMQREQAAQRALQQYQQVMPIAQEYLSRRPDFEKWLQSQQAQPQQPQPAAPQEKPWWNPPELTESHRRYLVKDENGRDVISPNAPLDVQRSLTEWLNYRADFASKFLSNPQEALGPMVAEMAQKQAQELIRQTLETRDRESFVESFQKENADWLLDPNTGSVSPEGLLFHKYVEQAREWGLPPGKARADFAVDMTELAMLRQRYQSDIAASQGQVQPQQPQAPQPQPQIQQPQVQAQPEPDLARQNMSYLRREASRNPSRSAGTANNDTRQPKPSQTFEQMLAENLRAASIIQ